MCKKLLIWIRNLGFLCPGPDQTLFDGDQNNSSTSVSGAVYHIANTGSCEVS
jgi:hypothetical protein